MMNDIDAAEAIDTMAAMDRPIPSSAVCQYCATSALTKGARLPRGWKRLGGPICPACLGQRFVHRAIVLPIASPLDHTWVEFGSVLRVQWAATTQCANWLVTQLYARDVRRTAGETTLRPMPACYLYPEARAQFPAIVPINLTSLIQSVEQTYRRQRYELLWTGARSLATFCYPTPLPLHATSWRLEETAGGAIVAHVRGDHQWRALRLRGGAEFHKQRAWMSALSTGAALGGAGALYRIAARPADHRGAIARSRVLLKIAAYVPRPQRAASDRILVLGTSGSDLLIGRIAGRGVVVTLSGDQLRRGIAGFDVAMGRVQRDVAVSRRWIPAVRHALIARRADLSRRRARAVRTWCQQLGAAVARAAVDLRVGTVQYADEAREFGEDVVPWDLLRRSIACAVDGAGVTWLHLSGTRDDDRSQNPQVVEEV